jgi:hypothetical protein
MNVEIKAINNCIANEEDSLIVQAGSIRTGEQGAVFAPNTLPLSVPEF